MPQQSLCIINRCASSYLKLENTKLQHFAGLKTINNNQNQLAHNAHQFGEKPNKKSTPSYQVTYLSAKNT